MEILNSDKLYWFIIIILPGFISMKIWTLIVPSESRKLSEYIYESIAYSCINYALLFWFIGIIYQESFRNSHHVLFLIFQFLILFIFPVLWPIILHKIMCWHRLHENIIHPSPTSWDYFFSTGQQCFILVHLKNGGYIGGRYGNRSFASSFPNIHDIYLEEVWEIDENGTFTGEMIESSKGLWIDNQSFEYLEIFEIIEEN